MSKMQRDKGKRGELEVVHILKEAGYDVDRVPNSGGLRWKGDIYGFGDYHIECKFCEQVRLNDWVKQATEQAQGKPWLLIHRRSREEWKVTMPLSQWLAEQEV